MADTKALDQYLGLKWLKDKVDGKYKEAERSAIDGLSELNDEHGVMEITSTVFGPEAGKLKYSQTRKKTVVEFNVCDVDDFTSWLVENPDAAEAYAIANAKAMGEWWFGQTGELPDGISRVEYEEPARIGPPKLYGFDSEAIEQKLGGNWIEGMNSLLLGDGNDID